MRKEWVIRERPAVEPLVPDYGRDILDPFLMTGMAGAVARLLLAIKDNERIMIFADYDADGVPGAAILSLFFQKIGFTNFSVYLPDRHLEDYGLSLTAVDQAKADGVSLLVTIDCGIANAREVAYAKNLGIETIVTDHHAVPAEVPEAIIVLDPNQKLCGAGVVFKLVQALAVSNFPQVLGNNPQTIRKITDGSGSLAPLKIGWEKWLLDLVAIATVSDMVPLTGENRALVHFGLKVLRKSPRPGIVELCRALRLRQENITEDDIAFLIGPRINAASRMAHAREAFELLTTTDVARAATIANRLEKLNKERRKCVNEILSAVSNFPQVLGNNPQTVRKITDGLESPILVVGHETWSLGVLGLTASRLVETYRCPVFIWGKNGNGMIKGSCRSDGTINVVELMRGVGEDFFLNIGGHRHAGGFSLAHDKLAELESRLLGAFKTLDKKIIEETLEIDAELELAQVTPVFFRELVKLSPFGIGNPKPVFLFRDVEVVSARKFGDGQAHLELDVKHRVFNIKTVSFFNTFSDVNLSLGQKIDLAASIEQNFFRSNGDLRLRIVDLKSRSRK